MVAELDGGELPLADVGGFRDRADAGQRLGSAVLAHLEQIGQNRALAARAVVIALPRGGVLVGAEVAKVLAAPLDIWVVRKIGVPGHEELGLGAVAEGGHTYLSADITDLVRISPDQLARLTRRKIQEVEKRTQMFRGPRPPPSLGGKIVVLVDDGIATGGTIRAAARAMRAQQPERLILAVPVAAAETARALHDEGEVDDVVCLELPASLQAVGAWYDDFRQVADDEVVTILQRAHQAGKDDAR